MLKYKEFLFEAEDYDNDSGDKFWGNTGAGVLVYSKATNKFLVGVRSIHVNEPNTIGVFGGAVDEDVQFDMIETAKREFIEETQYQGGFNEIISLYVFETENKSFTYYNFLGIIDNEFEPILDKENEDFKWLSFEELNDIEPKHFGLELLLHDDKSIEIIKKICNV